MNSESTRREHGFSLVEMMAAIAIFAMAGLIIGSSLQAFARSWRQGERAARRLERFQALDRVAETLLRNTIPFDWPDSDDNNNARLVFSGEPDELWLTAQGRTRSGADPLRFVRLYLENNQLRCDWATTPLLPWKELDSLKYETEMITDGVRSISFLYAAESEDGDGIEWNDLWEEEEREGLPLAIQITVEWEDGTRERWLRRVAAAGGSSALGVTYNSYFSGNQTSNQTESGGGGRP